MHVTLISPNIVTQKGDYFSSGIPYMPVTLAYLTAYLREKKHEVHVIDAFGECPEKITLQDNYIIQGLTLPEILQRVQPNTQHVFLYAGQVVSHNTLLALIHTLRNQHPELPITIVENTQSVVAYALAYVAEDFLTAGATFLITGEAELRAQELLQGTSVEKIDGLIFRKEKKTIHNKKKHYLSSAELDTLPFPAWDLFPVKNYWKLGYAHGPFTRKKYISILTSRGCGLLCNFCVVPETNEGKWRSRSAQNVVAEIQHWINTLGVREFHIQDLNPTTYKKRIQEIAQLILDKNLRITWKFVAGTKIETLDKPTLDIAARAGCTYVSLSPESGSSHVLKLMRKSFVHDYGLELVRHMHTLGITTQACFVLGYPGETDEDILLSINYARDLARAGIDELALFIMTPIPGSTAYREQKLKDFVSLDQLTFTPTWRSDYAKLSRVRWTLYAKFFFWKLRYHPFKLLKQPFYLLSGRFNTKTEQAIYHALKLQLLILKAKITSLLEKK